MHTYPRFPKDARKIFHPLIEQYRLAVKSDPSGIALRNQRYVLYFSPSPGALSAVIHDLQNGAVIGLEEHLKVSKEEVFELGDRRDFQSIQQHLRWELERYKRMLEAKGEALLQGKAILLRMPALSRKADFIDKLAWICLQDGKILSTRSRGKEVWYIPGGKREAGESDLEALTREIREELRVELIPATLKRHGVFEAQADGHPAGTMVRMTCYLADYDGELKAAAEIESIRFLTYADKPISSPVDQLILADLLALGWLRY